MVSRRKALSLAGLLASAVACTPEFTDRSSAVTGARVLAIGSSPAEALPGSDVTYKILVVDANGLLKSPNVSWSYCTQPKPTNELNDVATACFENSALSLPLGFGVTPKGTLPINGCAQFGPDVPQPASSPSSNSGMGASSSGSAIHQTQGRPTDPDSTDGYYQPVILRVTAGADRIPTLGETRITCGLAGSTGEQFEAYNRATKRNENPQLLGVTINNMQDSALATLDAGEPLQVAASAHLSLRASWPACPTKPQCGDGICSPGEAVQDCPDDCTTPKGCGGSEPFAYLDPESHELVDRHESIRVSWFATRGSFDTDHTGRQEGEFTETSSDDTWSAPSEAGPAFIWVVLRDDRGGVDWQSFRVDVR